MGHIVSSMCVRYEDTVWILVVSWSCTHSCAPWKVCKHVIKRSICDITRPSTPSAIFPRWLHIPMIHMVNPMCKCDEDTPWILVVSWAHNSPRTRRKHNQTRWHGYMDADGAHYKWPGVVQHAQGTNSTPYGNVIWICFMDTRCILALAVCLFCLRIRNKNKHHQPNLLSWADRDLTHPVQVSHCYVVHMIFMAYAMQIG